jgi:hypothetical protein
MRIEAALEPLKAINSMAPQSQSPTNETQLTVTTGQRDTRNSVSSLNGQLISSSYDSQGDIQHLQAPFLFGGFPNGQYGRPLHSAPQPTIVPTVSTNHGALPDGDGSDHGDKDDPLIEEQNECEESVVAPQEVRSLFSKCVTDF